MEGTSEKDMTEEELKKINEAIVECSKSFSEFKTVVKDNEDIASFVDLVATGMGKLAGISGCLNDIGIEIPLLQGVLGSVADILPGAGVAITLLSTAVEGLSFIFSNTETETEKMMKRLDELTQSVEESIAEYESEQKAADIMAEAYKNAATELKALLENESKSVETKNRINVLVERLNQGLPNLSLAYDEQTNSLNMTTEALDQLIAAQNREVEYDMAVENTTELLEKRKEAVNNLWEAERLMKEEQEKLNEMEINEYDSRIETSYVIDQQRNNVQQLTESYNEAKEALEEIDQELELAQENMVAYQLAQVGTSESTISQRDTLLEEAEALRGNAEDYGLVKDAIAALDEQYLVHVSEQQARIEEIKEQQAALSEAYDQTYQKTYDTLTSEMGLFNSVSTEADRSMGDLLKSLDDQVEYMKTYSDNLEAAVGMGVDKGLIEQLSDGSEESARILQAIVNDGGTNVDELNAKLEQVELGKEAFSRQVAQMSTNFSKEWKNMQAELESNVAQMNKAEEAYSAGMNTIQGFINGSEGMKAKVKEVYVDLAEDAIRTFENTLEQKSPSRVFHRIGAYNMVGAIEGTKEMVPLLKNTYADSAQAAIAAYSRQAEEMGQELEVNRYIRFMAEPEISGLDRGGFFLTAVERVLESMEKRDAGGITQNVTIVNPKSSAAENARAIRKVGRELAFG